MRQRLNATQFCHGKRKYATRQAADKARRKTGMATWLRIYECPRCATYHLTKQRAPGDPKTLSSAW